MSRAFLKVASLALAMGLGLPALPTLAVQPDEILADPALEARARSLSQGMRCLVCRNENIDDSDAALARDLRLLLRARLVAGDSDADAVAYIVDRYGEYVLLDPQANGSSLILWATGPGLLGLGGLLAWQMLRRRARAEAAAALSPEEEARLAELMAPD